MLSKKSTAVISLVNSSASYGVSEFDNLNIIRFSAVEMFTNVRMHGGLSLIPLLLMIYGFYRSVRYSGNHSNCRFYRTTGHSLFQGFD